MKVVPPILPSLETVREGINELLLVENWDSFKAKRNPIKYQERLHKLFTSKLKIMPLIVQPVTPNTFNFKFYRLRRYDRTMNERLISEYSYPPNSVIKYVQRANIPYHPVFYCSDSPLTAIFETVYADPKHTKDSIYYLSEWALRKDVDLRISPFLFNSIDPVSPFRIMADWNIEKVKEQLKEYSENQVNGYLEILNFLSQLFVFTNTYVVTSFIAHSNLYADHIYRPDIFIYPSVKTDRKTVNFAIHPNSVNEKLILERVFKLRVTELNKETNACNVFISHVGLNINGTIGWIRPNDDTEQGRKIDEDIKILFGQKIE